MATRPIITETRGLALVEEKVRFPLPLVGREEDLAWLEERREDAQRALGGARLIGEAGVGKTRLMREFLLLCAAAGDSVVVGHASLTLS